MEAVIGIIVAIAILAPVFIVGYLVGRIQEQTETIKFLEGLRDSMGGDAE